MLFQNFGPFFLVSNVRLALLAIIIGKWTTEPPIEPIDQIQNGISGKSSTKNFQDAERHFPNLYSLDGKMKLVSERHCDVLSNVIHETVTRGHEYQRCSEGAAVTIEVHRTLHLRAV